MIKCVYVLKHAYLFMRIRIVEIPLHERKYISSQSFTLILNQIWHLAYAIVIFITAGIDSLNTHELLILNDFDL